MKVEYEALNVDMKAPFAYNRDNCMKLDWCWQFSRLLSLMLTPHIISPPQLIPSFCRSRSPGRPRLWAETDDDPHQLLPWRQSGWRPSLRGRVATAEALHHRRAELLQITQSMITISYISNGCTLEPAVKFCSLSCEFLIFIQFILVIWLDHFIIIY